jgi:hypothetical protein
LLYLDEVGWLDEVVIKTRFPRVPQIGFLSVPRNSDQHDVLENGLLTYLIRYLI